jgi:PAS domain S-box-containing protein
MSSHVNPTVNAFGVEMEMAALQQTLQEAHDVCQAIRAGQVDAVVVGQTDEEKRVLLFSDAYTRYRQLVEDMAQGAVTVAKSGEILFANHSFAAMLDEQLIDLFRTTLANWVPAGDRGRLAPLLAPHVGERDVEVNLVRRNGAKLPVRFSVVTSSDDFVTLLVTPVAQEHINEAEATLEAIRKGAVDAFVVGGKQVLMLDSASAPYRTLVERMRQGAVTVQHDGSIVYANERFVAMIGVPHGRLLGSPLSALVAESDRAAFASMLAARENAQAEVKLRCANGERPIVQTTMTSLDGHKLFLFTDLTEQKRHEASDERTRKFLGMLAHEFRNILGPIGNSVEVLKRKNLDADGQKSVDMIERQTSRLLGLVEDLRRINPRE